MSFRRRRLLLDLDRHRRAHEHPAFVLDGEADVPLTRFFEADNDRAIRLVFVPERPPGPLEVTDVVLDRGRHAEPLAYLEAMGSWIVTGGRSFMGTDRIVVV